MKKKFVNKKYRLIFFLTIISIFLGIFTFNQLIKTENIDYIFKFAVVGDLGFTEDTEKNLKSISRLNYEFLIVPGDISYGHVLPESKWCSKAENILGIGLPVLFVAGNHDSDGESEGQHIDEFIKCFNHSRTKITGEYGKEYYFDYPEKNPEVRFIFTSPGLVIDKKYYDYSNNNYRLNEISALIDDARAKNINWVISVNHFNCISLGAKKHCEMGEDYFNFLISKKVDLILQGHDHTYQRSTQIRLSNLCGKISAGLYDRNCIHENKDSVSYEKGDGSIILILGSGGMSLYDIDLNDNEKGFFKKFMGRNIDPSFGHGEIKIFKDRLEFNFIKSSGNFKDKFIINK